MLSIIRQLRPDIKLVIGGPECFFIKNSNCDLHNLADYIVVGEGEESIIDVLNFPEEKILENSNITPLDDLPSANYDDYQLDKYKKKGI